MKTMQAIDIIDFTLSIFWCLCDCGSLCGFGGIIFLGRTWGCTCGRTCGRTWGRTCGRTCGRT